MGCACRSPLYLSVLPSVEGDFSASACRCALEVDHLHANATEEFASHQHVELYSTAPAREVRLQDRDHARREQDATGWQRYNYLTRFDSVSALQPSGRFFLDAIYFDEELAFLQVTDAVLCSLSDLDLSSRISGHRAGPSAYANSEQGRHGSRQVDPVQAWAPPSRATPSRPSAPWRPASRGASFTAETRRMDCVAEIAQEMWLALSPNSSGFDLGGVQADRGSRRPLGAIEDIITEPVIEYATADGSRRAYIASVDKEWDWSKASEFRGGWGSRDNGYTSIDLGYYIWQLCRRRTCATGQAIQDDLHAVPARDGRSAGHGSTQAATGSPHRVAVQPAALRPVQHRRGRGRSPVGRLPGDDPWADGRICGYDVSAWATDPVLVTEVSRSVQDMAATVTVMLPPVVADAPINRIVRTFNAADRIVQSFDAGNRIIQEI